LTARTTIQPDSRKSSTKRSPNGRQDRRHAVVPGRRSGLQRAVDVTEGLNPEVIFVPGYYNDVGLIAKQARDKGITVPLIGGDGWDSEQLYAIGGTA
jgi:ABC-type branched-subunit amino acid transport system substrate-binding protein